MLNGKLLEKPEVRIGPSGVSRVDPAEILRSRAGQAEINLLGSRGAAEVEWSVGIKKSDLRRLMAEIVEHRDALQAAWDEIHG